MKHTGMTILMVIFVGFLSAQNIHVHEQYVFDRYLLNPAFCGLGEGTNIKLTHRQQWVGFENSPKTSFLSLTSRPAGQPMGLGAYVYNDMNGPNQRIGAQFTFAYHLLLRSRRYDQTILSMALSFNGQYHILDESGFDRDMFDPIITYTRLSSFLPDFNAGAVLTHTNMMVGFSADHLIPGYDKIYNRELEEALPMVMNMHAAYIVNLQYNFKLKPLLNVRTDMKGHTQMELMARVSYGYGKRIQSAVMRYPNEFYVGFCYRHTLDYTNSAPLSFQPFFGVKVGAFTFSYMFDMGLTAIQLNNYGSHQISIGLFFVGDKTMNVGRNKIPINNNDF
ncbi:MAG: type IX secretion system membrane protein PorP/SprF [Bacteroidales bacterium]|nr:type IX secretion system membrane protein PorP/SprF [Bacteroidales bacterium]